MCKMDTYNASDIYTEIHLWFKFHFVIYQSSINNLTNNLSSDKNETRYIPYNSGWFTYFQFRLSFSNLVLVTSLTLFFFVKFNYNSGWFTYFQFLKLFENIKIISFFPELISSNLGQLNENLIFSLVFSTWIR